MRINYVTTNEGKVESLRRCFSGSNIEVIQQTIDLPEPRSSDVQFIAEHKARSAYSLLKEPLIVQDSGFYIPSLNGFPRAFVNFALETIGLEGILKLVEGNDRTGEFRECLAYIDENNISPVFFTSSLKGVFSTEPRGKMQNHLWSKLALIFIPPHSSKTLGEMGVEEYIDFWKAHPRESSCSRQFSEWYKGKCSF